MSGPLIADFDQNGTMDVFVVAGYGTYTPDSLNTGKAFLIEAGEGYCPEWLMFRHDVRRSGYLPTDEINQQCDTSSTSVIKHKPVPISIYPNPATDRIFIELDSEKPLTISLFDASGREVMKQHANASISVGHLPMGMYLVKLESAEKSYSEKLMIIR